MKFYHIPKTPCIWVVLVLLTQIGTAVLGGDDSSASNSVATVPREVNLGDVKQQGVSKILVQVQSRNEGVQLSRIAVSCGCLSVGLPADQDLPVSLTKDGVEFELSIDVSGFEGAFRKIVYIGYTLEEGGELHIIELPVYGVVAVDESWSAAIAEGTPRKVEAAVVRELDIRDADIDTPDSLLVKHMVVFVSPKCDMCKWLELEWLPSAVRRGYTGVVFRVDVTTNAGVKRLVGLEDRLGIERPGGRSPVVYYRGEFYYGTEAIAKITIHSDSATPKE